MDREIENVIVKIHGTPHKSVLAVAGAGSGAMSWLLGVSGASRTLLETRVPYGRMSMIDLVGEEPSQYVSPQNARDMARSCYRRGLALLEDESPVVGLPVPPPSLPTGPSGATTGPVSPSGTKSASLPTTWSWTRAKGTGWGKRKW